MDNGFDCKELKNYEKKLIKMAHDTLPKESKQFLRKAGSKLKTKTSKTARSLVKKKNNNYYKSIKRGKAYKWTKGDGAWAIRVYSSAPHAHLIENGHRLIRNGKEVGFVQGKFVFKKAQKSFESEYYELTQKWIDELLRKGL